MIRNVLFDLDDTLLDFHRAEAEAIRYTLKEFGIDPTNETIALYSRINRSCWAKLETGEYTREEVLHRRFDMLFATLGVTGDAHETQSYTNTDSASEHITSTAQRSYSTSCTESTVST